MSRTEGYENWPPEALSRFEQLYLDERTLVIRNDPERPYSDRYGDEWTDQLLAFDAENLVVSAVGRFEAGGNIVGEITFGLGGKFDAATPADMAAQIEIYVDGFFG